MVNEADVVNAAGGVADVIFITILIILLVVILGIVAWFIWFKLQFKHRITLRLKTKGDTDLIINTDYRYVKVKGETEKIQIWFKKRYLPIPPEEAKDFTQKGKEYTEGYLTETGEIFYIKTNNKPDANSFRNKEIIDTDDKEFYANAYFEAQRFKRKSLLEWISENAGLIALVLIFVLMLAFWEDITKPMVKVAGQNAQITETNAEILESLEAIIRDKQSIPKETEGGGAVPD